MQLTKDEAAVCLMLSFLTLMIAVVGMSIGDASLAQPHMISSPNLGLALFMEVANALRYVSLVGLIAGLIGTLILPSRHH